MIDAEMIKADLLSLDTRDFYIKYIVKSKYWYFSDYLEVPGDEVIDVLDRFKEIVSEHFHISFHSLQGDFFRMSVENVFLLPAIFFFRVPDQGFLACIIHHACKPPKIEKPEEKYN